MKGHRIAQYELISELGRGGMGIVYEAQDTQLERRVALKVLPANSLTSEDDRARFYREARAAARLSHPHICHVYQVDEAETLDAGGKTVSERQPFIAMEFVDGESLAARIARGPVSIEEAIRLTMELASAIGAAHEAGVVHRDIKPGNVMTTARGEAKVLDFGLAKTSASTQLTRQGSTLGTTAYMSPEQARGEEVDGRADLWSIGVVLYEMICGVRPFAADYDQAALYAILNEDPEPPTSRRTGVPMDLEAVIFKCMRKDRALRYQTAADLVADLKAVTVLSSGSGSTTRTHTTIRPAAAPIVATTNRSNVPVMLAVGLVGLLLGAALIWALGKMSAPGVGAGAVRQLLVETAPLANATDPILSADGRLAGFVGLDSTSGRSAIGVRNLATGDFRLLASDDIIFLHGFSPDGSWVLYSIPNGLRVVRSSGGAALAVADVSFSTGAWESNETFLFDTETGIMRGWIDGRSPQAVLVADSSRGHVFITPPRLVPGSDLRLSTVVNGRGQPSLVAVNVEKGTYQVIVEDGSNGIPVVAGSMIYRSGGRNGPWVLRRIDGKSLEPEGPPVPLGPPFDRSVDVALSDEGTAVMVTDKVSGSGGQLDVTDSAERLVRILDLASGQYRPVNIEPGLYSVPTVSPDGGSVAMEVFDVAGNRNQITSYDLSSGFETPIGRFTRQDNPAYSPDGRQVAYDTRLDGGRKLFVAGSDGSSVPTQVRTPEPTVSEPFFHPDGRRLVYRVPGAQGRDQIRAIPLNGTASELVVQGDFPLFDPSVSPDGRLVAVEGSREARESSNIVIVFEYGGDGQWPVPCSETCYDPQWSSDGRFLYFRDRLHIYRVAIETRPGVRIGPAESVATLSAGFSFALMPDDRSAVVVEIEASLRPQIQPLNVILNWHTELESLLTGRSGEK